MELIHFSDNNISKISGNILSESSKSESVQTLKENLDKNEQSHFKLDEYEDEAIPSTSKTSILKLNNISHKIQKCPKKHKKTLSDFIL